MDREKEDEGLDHRVFRVVSVIAASALSACGQELAPPISIEGPAIDLGPNASAPLAARLTLETDRPVRLVARTSTGDETWEHAYSALSASWDVPLLGFLPDTTHTVTIVATDAEGHSSTFGPIAVATPRLPATFPTLEVSVADAHRSEPGFTVFAVPPRAMGLPSHVVALDQRGRVLWYYESMARVSDAVPTIDGTILLNVGRTRIVEIDMLGRTLRALHARRDGMPPADSTAVATDTFHHEVTLRDDGGFLVLSTAVHDVEGYPTSELDPTPRATIAHVISDLVVELAPDGTIEHALDLFDVLDPNRVVYDSFSTFWDVTYPDLRPGTIDWTHANAVVRDGDDYIVSMRHQDAVVAMSRTGEVRWILGPPGRWTGALADRVLSPVGEGYEHPYKMHSPQPMPGGRLMMFDNGVGRAIPPDPELTLELRWSRAVEYEIDETAGTVRQVWEYGRERGFELYSSIVGDADPLPASGNVLIVFGGILPVEDGVPGAYIVEVTHEQPAAVVLEVRIADDNEEGPASRIVYRAEHVAALYPPGV